METLVPTEVRRTPISQVQKQPVIPSKPEPDQRIQLSWGNGLFFLTHIGALMAFFVPFTWTALGICLAVYFVRTLSITGGYHRYFAHHSFKISRFNQFVLAFIGGTCAQKGVLWWVAHHRHHHQYSDTPEDIHSAERSGFYWAHLGWLLSREYHEAYNPEMVKDLRKFPELVWLDRYHLIPPILLAGACLALGGITGLVWWFCVSTVMLYHSTFSVNSVCHLWGSRPYKTSDSSRNTWWLALATLGESWHNNHHRFPNSARHGLRWWEIDLTYWTLRLLSQFKLVRSIRVVSPDFIGPKATGTAGLPDNKRHP
jgi:stearoyl-CoA desaturase (Delta-9 desaturase)